MYPTEMVVFFHFNHPPASTKIMRNCMLPLNKHEQPHTFAPFVVMVDGLLSPKAFKTL